MQSGRHFYTGRPVESLCSTARLVTVVPFQEEVRAVQVTSDSVMILALHRSCASSYRNVLNKCCNRSSSL